MANVQKAARTASNSRYFTDGMDNYTMNKMSELQARFLDLMSDVDESALIVLKSHLLIEEVLERIIGKFVFHAEFLEATRLSFHQKVAIARSISLDEHENEMWALVLSLNALRNDLAHQLHSTKRTAKTKAVIDSYFQIMRDVPGIQAQRGAPENVGLANSAAVILGFLSSFEAEVDRFKSVVGTIDKIMNPHRG